MGIVIALIIGLVAGALAKLLMPGRDPGGVGVTIVLGVVGAAVAYGLGALAGWYRNGEGPGIIAATVGAMLVLYLGRGLSQRRAWGP